VLVVVLLWLVVVAGAAGSAVDAVLDGPAGRRGPLLRQGRELDGDGQAVDAVLAQARILVRALVRLVVLREQTRLGGQRGAREEALRLLLQNKQTNKQNQRPALTNGVPISLPSISIESTVFQMKRLSIMTAE